MDDLPDARINPSSAQDGTTPSQLASLPTEYVSNSHESPLSGMGVVTYGGAATTNSEPEDGYQMEIYAPVRDRTPPPEIKIDRNNMQPK
jgi:hypothetical protein